MSYDYFPNNVGVWSQAVARLLTFISGDHGDHLQGWYLLTHTWMYVSNQQAGTTGGKLKTRELLASTSTSMLCLMLFSSYWQRLDNEWMWTSSSGQRWSPDRRRVFSGTGVSGQGVAQWKGCVGQENYWMKKLTSSFCIDLSIPTWIGLGYARGWHWGFLFLLKNMGSF